MKLHHEGKTYILTSLILVIAASFFMAYMHYAWWTILITLFFFFFLVIFLQFFRKPHRNPTIEKNAIISPCDGKVVVIEKVFEPEYLKTECTQISIFMSPFNVHINWYPIDGEVEYVKYHPGKYLVAWHPKSSTENERSSFVFKHSNGKKILVRQVAGILARKICYYAKEKSLAIQGKELGFIKFGSRVDLYIPLDAKILVNLDQVVKGSIDKIAEI